MLPLLSRGGLTRCSLNDFDLPKELFGTLWNDSGIGGLDLDLPA